MDSGDAIVKKKSADVEGVMLKGRREDESRVQLLYLSRVRVCGDVKKASSALFD